LQGPAEDLRFSRYWAKTWPI